MIDIARTGIFRIFLAELQPERPNANKIRETDLVPLHGPFLLFGSVNVDGANKSSNDNSSSGGTTEGETPSFIGHGVIVVVGPERFASER